MTRSAYRDRDYGFGQLVLTLRTRIGVSQVELATLIGISRRAVVGWEGGLSYPSVNHLIHFIELGVRERAFPLGDEVGAIQALWRLAHQKVLLDEDWLTTLLHSTPDIARVEPRDPPESITQPARESPSPTENALWTIPYARNLHFTGRDEILDQLMQHLDPNDVTQPETLRRAALTQSQVIKGLGGIGKSQIAIEFAYRARAEGRFAHTIWLNAASEEAILTSLAALSALLPPPFQLTGETDQRKLVAAVLKWLEDCPQPWLLILDNADDLVLMQPYVPLHGHGSVLLTTRASAVGHLAAAVEVETMGIIEGTELLLRRARRLEGASDEAINEAGNIVIALGQFPLALDQAGAYLEETGCNLQDYLAIYHDHRQALLARRGQLASQYPASVATTWELSFQFVERASPAAADLLRLCAFLAPDTIPEELLTQGAAYWPPQLRAAVSDHFHFNHLIETLLAFSLIKRVGEDRLLSIHRLVQVVQIERLGWDEQRQWVERLVGAMNGIFPQTPEERAQWPSCQRYLDQVQQCLSLVQTYALHVPEVAEVFDRAGTYLRERALYSLAEPLYRQAIVIKEHQPTMQALPLAISLQGWAKLSREQGRFAEAETAYQRALQIREQHLGPDHLLVAELYNDLAGLYRGQGQYAIAVTFCQQALQIREQHLGPGHLQLAESYNDLAVLYQNQDKYEEAEQLNQRALHIREQQLGSAHPDVAIALNNLAQLYISWRKFTDARLLTQRALEIWEQHYGPDHPMVANGLTGLAIIAFSEKHYDEAKTFNQRALQIREKQLGPDHHELIFPLNGIANIARMQGNFEEAEQLLQRALYIGEHQLEPGHLKVAFTLVGFAKLRRDQEKYEEAEEFLHQALHIREQQLGSDHLDIATVLVEFAILQQKRGELLEAQALYRRALAIQEGALGAEHPLSAATSENLRVVAEALPSTRGNSLSRSTMSGNVARNSWAA